MECNQLKSKHLVIVFFTLLSLFSGVKTFAQDYDEDEKSKVGIKIGLGFGTLLGEELENPRLGTGFIGGVYNRFKLGNHFNLQAEANVAFRGSKFRNGEKGYSSISLFYIDLPVLLMYNIKQENKINVVAGFQASILSRSTLFIKSSPLAQKSDLPLKTMDYLPCAGVHINQGVAGFQLLAKYGLININNGINYPDINPPQGKGMDIRNLVFELSVFF